MFNYLQNEELKNIFGDANFILLLRQPKKVQREFISSIFRTKNNAINQVLINVVTSDVCQIYLIRTDSFKRQLAKFGKSAEVSIVTL